MYHTMPAHAALRHSCADCTYTHTHTGFSMPPPCPIPLPTRSPYLLRRMECHLCGTRVPLLSQEWTSVSEMAKPKVFCGPSCSELMHLYADTSLECPTNTSNLQAQSDQWRATSHQIHCAPLIRVRMGSSGPVAEASRAVACGTRLCSNSSEIAPTLKCCTPNCLSIEGSAIASQFIDCGAVLTLPLPGATPRQSFFGSLLGCEDPWCQCRQQVLPGPRSLPCPLAPHCHGGRCLLRTSRGRWECLDCGSYWGPESFFESLAGEQRCMAAYTKVSASFYDGNGIPNKLDKSTFESLKMILSSLSDAGIGNEHGLFTLTCELFVDYFLAISRSMKGASTQQKAASMALKWGKALLKSALVQRSTWSRFGWFVGSVLSRIVEVSSRFSSLHTESVFLSRFGIASSLPAELSPGASHMAKLLSTSLLGSMFSVCESWISSFCDEPSDFQREWEDYLLSLTSNAINSNQIRAEQFLRSQ